MENYKIRGISLPVSLFCLALNLPSRTLAIPAATTSSATCYPSTHVTLQNAGFEDNNGSPWQISSSYTGQSYIQCPGSSGCRPSPAHNGNYFAQLYYHGKDNGLTNNVAETLTQQISPTDLVGKTKQVRNWTYWYKVFDGAGQDCSLTTSLYNGGTVVRVLDTLSFSSITANQWIQRQGKYQGKVNGFTVNSTLFCSPGNFGAGLLLDDFSFVIPNLTTTTRPSNSVSNGVLNGDFSQFDPNPEPQPTYWVLNDQSNSHWDTVAGFNGSRTAMRMVSTYGDPNFNAFWSIGQTLNVVAGQKYTLKYAYQKESLTTTDGSTCQFIAYANGTMVDSLNVGPNTATGWQYRTAPKRSTPTDSTMTLVFTMTCDRTQTTDLRFDLDTISFNTTIVTKPVPCP